MSHLEDLIAEYYDWQGYVVKRNIRVGKLAHGGWEMELDIVAHHPHTMHNGVGPTQPFDLISKGSE